MIVWLGTRPVIVAFCVALDDWHDPRKKGALVVLQLLELRDLVEQPDLGFREKPETVSVAVFLLEARDVGLEIVDEVVIVRSLERPESEIANFEWGALAWATRCEPHTDDGCVHLGLVVVVVQRNHQGIIQVLSLTLVPLVHGSDDLPQGFQVLSYTANQLFSFYFAQTTAIDVPQGGV